MEATVSNALFLLAVGMITVFAILLLVVVTGDLLIRIINKWTPEEKSPAMVISDEETRVVISKIVEKVSKGKARIERIEPL